MLFVKSHTVIELRKGDAHVANQFCVRSDSAKEWRDIVIPSCLAKPREQKEVFGIEEWVGFTMHSFVNAKNSWVDTDCSPTTIPRR